MVDVLSQSCPMTALLALALVPGVVRDLLHIARAASLSGTRSAFDEADPDDLIPAPLVWPAPERAHAPARRSA